MCPWCSVNTGGWGSKQWTFQAIIQTILFSLKSNLFTLIRVAKMTKAGKTTYWQVRGHRQVVYLGGVPRESEWGVEDLPTQRDHIGGGRAWITSGALRIQSSYQSCPESTWGSPRSSCLRWLEGFLPWKCISKLHSWIWVELLCCFRIQDPNQTIREHVLGGEMLSVQDDSELTRRRSTLAAVDIEEDWLDGMWVTQSVCHGHWGGWFAAR